VADGRFGIYLVFPASKMKEKGGSSPVIWSGTALFLCLLFHFEIEDIGLHLGKCAVIIKLYSVMNALYNFFFIRNANVITVISLCKVTKKQSFLCAIHRSCLYFAPCANLIDSIMICVYSKLVNERRLAYELHRKI
jgi:hypothetical protein